MLTLIQRASLQKVAPRTIDRDRFPDLAYIDALKRVVSLALAAWLFGAIGNMKLGVWRCPDSVRQRAGFKWIAPAPSCETLRDRGMSQAL